MSTDSNSENHKPAKATPKKTATAGTPISRKKLAGQGRKQEPGTVFGSRWTDDERVELQ